MAVTITYADGSTLTVDASLRQAHEVQNEVTDHPIESGSNVADHIRSKPREYTLDGVVSATPIVNPGEVPDANRHVAAYHKMDAAALASEMVSVKTSRKTYTNMAIQSFASPQEPKTGVDFYFTLRLKEIVFVTTATVTVPKIALQAGATRNMASAKAHRGKRQATAATAGQSAAAKKGAVKNAAAKPKPRTESWALQGLKAL